MEFKIVKNALNRNSIFKFIELENSFYNVKIYLVERDEREITEENPDKYYYQLKCVPKKLGLFQLYWSRIENEVLYVTSTTYLDNKQLDDIKENIDNMKECAKKLKEIILKIRKGEMFDEEN